MNQKTPKAGFEPATKRLTVASSAAELLGIENTGQMGFEPTTSAVTGQRSKPLNYYPVWAGLDLNQRRLSQRIYSPSPLTTRTPTRKRGISPL